MVKHQLWVAQWVYSELDPLGVLCAHPFDQRLLTIDRHSRHSVPGSVELDAPTERRDFYQSSQGPKPTCDQWGSDITAVSPTLVK